MLVLSRKKGQTILIGDEIEVKVIRVRGGRVQIGINCPSSIPIDRYELLQQKRAVRSQESAQSSDLLLREVNSGRELQISAHPF